MTRQAHPIDLDLPSVPPAVGNFVPAAQVGNRLHLSGQGPLLESGDLARGRVGDDVSVDEARYHSERTGLVLLAAANDYLDGLQLVSRALWVFGMIQAVPGFRELDSIADGCSEVFVTAFGESGRHARTIVGVSALPGGISVEYLAILEIGG